MVEPDVVSIIRRIYEEMCHVQADERVLVIADTRTPADIVDAFFDVACDLGADACVLRVPIPPPPALQTSIEWSPIVKDASRAADLIVDLVVGYADFIVEAVRRGTRVIGPGDGTGNEFLGDVLVRTMGRADITALHREADRLAGLLTDASLARITSEQGTDLTIDLEGIVGEAADGFLWDPDRGRFKTRWDLLPPAQPGVTLPAGRANGTIAVDGFVLWSPEDIEVPDTPVVIDVEDGVIVRIGGDSGFASKLTEWLESFAPDRSVWQGPAHFNLGTNPYAELTDHQEFERLRGTITFGWGDSAVVAALAELDPTLPWVASPVHWDTMIRFPSLALDGETVVDRGSIGDLGRDASGDAP